MPLPYLSEHFFFRFYHADMWSETEISKDAAIGPLDALAFYDVAFLA
jgi:hypothetical protein